ncbi:MAG: alpha/beta fold hydrolase [Planctomycetota bacterium]
MPNPIPRTHPAAGVLVLLLLAARATPLADPSPTARLLPADPPAVAVPATPASSFFWFEVRQNRDDPQSLTIRIPVFRFASSSARAAADPVLVMLGGPGVATTSMTPVLILVGTYDPLTPPAWADHLAAGLEHATVVRFETWGHSPLFHWDRPTGMALADAFLRHPAAPLPADHVRAASARS